MPRSEISAPHFAVADLNNVDLAVLNFPLRLLFAGLAFRKPKFY